MSENKAVQKLDSLYKTVREFPGRKVTISAETAAQLLDYITELESKATKEDNKPVPAPVTLPETTRVELGVLYPAKPGEDASAHTNRILGHAKDYGTYRQCSIDWHEECSQRGLGEDAECNCLCHAEGTEIYSVEGHAEGGVVTVIRAERGKHLWPPQEGEPETMWAWWVYARSETEAAVQGATKERNRLA